MNQGISKLAKLLASDELKNRKIGYKYACELLKLHPGTDDAGVSYIDILGVCKGLYYSLWMQDKPLLQEEATARIVKLISIIKNRDVRSMYVKGVLATLAKEWESLDFWRQDKFMMLVRDFLVRCIVLVKKRALGPEIVASSIFDSILNSDFNSAVDLKLHLIVVLKEELLNAGEVPSLVNAFFKHTLDSVQKMPKGSVYVTDMVTLLNFLAKEMRKYPKFPFGKISEELLVLSTQFPLYRKTFLRISKILHVKKSQLNSKVIRESTQKSTKDDSKSSFLKMSQLNGEAKKNVTEVHQSAESEILSAEEPQVNGDNKDCSKIPPEVDSTEVLTDKSKSHNPRKRKMTDESPNPNEESSRTKRLKEDSNYENESGPQIESTDVKQSIEVDVTLKETGTTLSAGLTPLKDSNFNILMAPTNLQQLDMSILDSLNEATQSKRVSFGKVFCKKFSSTKKLADKPISIPTPPNRGILRR
nr:ribosomal RNA processing protein 1 [Hymenolepis microstoma]